MNAAEGCCIYPAYRDVKGNDLIIDTRNDLVNWGALSNDDNSKILEEEMQYLKDLDFWWRKEKKELKQVPIKNTR
jgi:hypothetical protein